MINDEVLPADELQPYSNRSNGKVRILLPVGNTNSTDKGRYNTSAFMRSAGLEIQGYEPGAPTVFPTLAGHPEYIFIPARPQAMHLLTSMGLADGFVCFDDVVAESSLAGMTGVQKIMTLLYGEARVVAAVRKSSGFRSLSELFLKRNSLKVYADYPFIAQARISQTQGYRKRFGPAKPLVTYFGFPLAGNNRLVTIIKSEGQTEWQNFSGAFELCVVLVSSGATIRNTRLRVIENLLNTRPGFFASKASLVDPHKRPMIEWLAARFRKGNQSLRANRNIKTRPNP